MNGKELINGEWYYFYPYSPRPEVKWYLKFNKLHKEREYVVYYYYLGEIDSNNYLDVHYNINDIAGMGQWNSQVYQPVSSKENNWLEECVKQNKVLDIKPFLFNPLLLTIYKELNLDY